MCFACRAEVGGLTLPRSRQPPAPRELRRRRQNHPLRKTTLSYAEASVVAFICFGPFVFWSCQAVLSGFPEAKFNDTGTVWSMFLELMLGGAAVFYLYARGFDLSSLCPSPTLRGSAIGLGVFVAAWLVGLLLVTPFCSPSEPRQAAVSAGGSYGQ